MKHSQRTSQSGFTLVEIAIVLVVIGLATGGVLLGGDLIRSARLRSITVEFNQYKTATETFMERYMAIPGDMPYAEDIWGQVDADPTTCRANQGIGTQTCDGDGDGYVDLSTSSIEVFRFWQHMELAELVDTNEFTGTRATNTSNESAVIDENVPRAFIEGSGWSVRAWGGGSSYTGGTGERFNLNYGNAFEYGGYNPDELTNAPTLTPLEAFGIDSKIDDGDPAEGDVIAYYWDDCTDATGAGDFVAEYDVDLDDRVCALIFRNAF
ncbi:MAG: type II secretion system GspH family protein [Rickettsiales bacterium]|nr:type II secretion system GspH family protein [Rickettsiales bacterium]